MKIKIKRMDKTLPLPAYQTNGSAGFDIYAREATVISPKQIVKIPSNLIVCAPTGHFLLVAARSSLGIKKNLMLSNSIGIVDSDFCGPSDELLISLYNFGDKEAAIDRGERIAQGIFIKFEKAEWDETDELSAPTRGGFGSTGK